MEARTIKLVEADELLTSRQVGIILNLSHRTVENKRRKGQIPSVLIPPRTIRYWRSEIRAMIVGLS